MSRAAAAAVVPLLLAASTPSPSLCRPAKQRRATPRVRTRTRATPAPSRRNVPSSLSGGVRCRDHIERMVIGDREGAVLSSACQSADGTRRTVVISNLH